MVAASCIQQGDSWSGEYREGYGKPAPRNQFPRPTKRSEGVRKACIKKELDVFVRSILEGGFSLFSEGQNGDQKILKQVLY